MDAHLRAIHAGAVTLHAAAEAAGHVAMTAAAASLLAQVEAAIDSGDAPQPMTSGATTICQHPAELRTTAGTISEGSYLKCRGCGARLN